MKQFLRRWLTGGFLVCLALATQANTVPPTPPPADFEAFFDGLVPHALRRADIPGAAVSIVKDGEVLFAKGYGYADLASHAPVIADRTLFRQGSLSKLFTWTAVMQLVEQGKLDLHADVNRYLDFRIPEAFGKPITLHDLLTHTAGFEEIGVSVGFLGVDQLLPLRDFLSRYVPKRIFAPGERIAYSNYGNGLAGYIVERVSAEPFATYVKRHIFEPLGMKMSTFEQPLPKDLAPFMSQGYGSASDATPDPFAFVQPAPAGALTAPVTDMVRFVIAHLQQGKFGDASILRPETIALMHACHYEVAPGANGFAYGFWQARRNGWDMLGHSGDVGAFHTSLYFIPAANYGIVVQLNGTGEAGRKLGSDVVRSEIVDAFMDRYLPGSVADEPTAATQAADAERVVGRYRTTRRNESLLKFMTVTRPDDEISALPDGTIQVSSRLLPSGIAKRWREVGPLIYREVDGQAHLYFVTNPAGEVTYWVSDDYPPAMVFERVTGLRGLGLLQPLFYLSSAILLLVALRAVIKRIQTRGQRPAPESALQSHWNRSRLAYGVQALVLIAWLVFVFTDLGGYSDGGSIIPLYLVRGASLLGIAAFVPAIIYSSALVRARTHKVQQMGECLVVLASLFIAWFLACYTL